LQDVHLISSATTLADGAADRIQGGRPPLNIPAWAVEMINQRTSTV
jgi:hypothetical protein